MKKVVLFLIITVSVVSAILLPNLSGRIVCSKQSFLMNDLKTVSWAVNFYISDHGVFPNNLDTLVAKSKLGPYLPSLPKDPWGRLIIYKTNVAKDSFEIISYGADGIIGGKDENEDRVIKSP